MARECVSKGTYKMNLNGEKEAVMKKAEHRVF